jgi:hypothetical protein
MLLASGTIEQRFKMDDSINPSTASPTEYLRWLQLREVQETATFGSWMSLSASESVRDPAALEASIERISSRLINSLGDIEGRELNDWERTILEGKEDLLGIQVSPTKIGNPAYHSILRSLAEHVEKAAAGLGHEVPEAVTFGILPTGRANGLACQVPAGGLIIAIDDGFFNLLYSLAKTIALFYEVTTSNGWEASLAEKDIVHAVQTNEEANRRWLEVLVATFVYGYPNLAPPRPLVDGRAPFVELLTTSVELFIVAHEYGHLVLGHLARDRTTLERKLSGGVEVEGFDIAREEELEADRVGLELLREYHRSVGHPVENTRAAVWFWAGCLNIIKEMLGEAPTHPSSTTRSKQLLRLLAHEDGIDEATLTPSQSIYHLMGVLRFHNWDRYEQWKQRALNGEMLWNYS